MKTKKVDRCCGITKHGKICKKKKLKNNAFCGIHNLCVICLDQCVDEKKLVCRHTFCKKCISKWIAVEINSSCPICRREVSYKENDECINYAFHNKLLSRVNIHQYILSDPQLNFISKQILEEDTSYTISEWTLFKNYIKNVHPEMEEMLNNCEIISYSFTKKYNEYDDNLLEENINNVYFYKICNEP